VAGGKSLKLDRIICGNCLEELPAIPEDSIDAIVTDPPYALTNRVIDGARCKCGWEGTGKKRFLTGACPACGEPLIRERSYRGKGFMGKSWDNGEVAFNPDFWFGCLRVLKPGGHLLAFGGSRTYHRMACAIEDAGFEIRDCLEWIYGSGFPKSLSIGRAIDKMEGNATMSKYLPDPDNKIYGSGKCKAAGVDRTPGAVLTDPPQSDLAKKWAGFGSALKPAHEPIVLARKPLDGCTIAENVLRWGVGGLNVDGCRVAIPENDLGKNNFKGNRKHPHESPKIPKNCYGEFGPHLNQEHAMGRFPANLLTDGSDAVRALFPETKSGHFTGHRNKPKTKNDYGTFGLQDEAPTREANEGSAARFFQACPFTEEDIPALYYCAKASRAEREKGCEGMPDVSKSDRMGGSAGHGNHNPVCQTCGKSKFDRGSGVCGCIAPDWKALNCTNKNNHPTIKPVKLISYLCRLITPPGGLVLDPFGGSGTTGLAAVQEGFHYILIEREAEYVEIARRRIAAVQPRLDRWVGRERDI
jgi:site-specific DNA-methyltransferase (adenine-specific)